MPAGAEFYNKAPRAYNEKLIRIYDIDYAESVLVGYRWYETKGIEPLYPFGFGLSYTTFSLSKPHAAKKFPVKGPLTVRVALTNTGSRSGAEVVQLYVSQRNPTVVRPKKELKAFRRVELAPGRAGRSNSSSIAAPWPIGTTRRTAGASIPESMCFRWELRRRILRWSYPLA